MEKYRSEENIDMRKETADLLNNRINSRDIICDSILTVKGPSIQPQQQNTFPHYITVNCNNQRGNRTYLYLNIVVIEILTMQERDYTMTNYQISMSLKSILAQLINSIFIPIIANYFIKDNIYY